ncbi:MAG TPA: hypothetical protein VN606_15805 [Thermoleophilaceae bacterium]|jgi:hypothetical protein|nr:hypothetical protein [Thermoleophilaceae bacterium]
MSSRSELRNERARAALEPLAPGERPPWVTAAAIVALVLAIGNIVAFAAGVKINGTRPAVGPVFGQAVLMGFVAWGMWNARYWAVLLMEAILALLIVVVTVLALRASTAIDVVIVVAILVPACLLFYKLVRAMARMQMPEPE